jgi:hypothetical protein
MTARMCRDIAEVRSAGALEPSRCFYSSDAWLSMLTEHGHRYQYPLVLDGCGAAAGVPLSAGTSVASRRYRPSVLADGRLDDAQCAVAGPLTGYRTALLRGHGTLAVADAAPDLLACAGVSTVLFPYLDSRDASDFEAAGFPVAFAAWEAWLDVPPVGLEEYQAGLPRAKRQRVAADLRKVRDAGMRFESGPLDVHRAGEHVDAAGRVARAPREDRSDIGGRHALQSTAAGARALVGPRGRGGSPGRRPAGRRGRVPGGIGTWGTRRRSRPGIHARLLDWARDAYSRRRAGAGRPRDARIGRARRGVRDHRSRRVRTRSRRAEPARRGRKGRAPDGHRLQF